MSRRETAGQVVRFGLVGVLNTGAYYGPYLLLRQVLPYLAAHLLAFALSVCAAFLLHSWLTYRTRPTWRAFLLFPLTVATSFVVTTVGVALLVEGFGVDERPAPLLAALAAVPVTFVATRAVLVGRAPAGAAEVP